MAPHTWARQLLSVHFGFQQLKAEGNDFAHGKCDNENAFMALLPQVIVDLQDELQNSGNMNDAAVNELIQTLRSGRVFDAKPSRRGQMRFSNSFFRRLTATPA